MNNFNFTPPEGFASKEFYPTKPTTEEETREQLQRPLTQLKTFINSTIVTSFNSLSTQVSNFFSNGGEVNGVSFNSGNLSPKISKGVSLGTTNTPYSSVNVGDCVKAANGSTDLTNGLVLQWFTVNTVVGSKTVTFPREFTSSCFSVNITSSTEDLGAAYNNLTKTTIDVISTKVGTVTIWAIGN